MPLSSGMKYPFTAASGYCRWRVRQGGLLPASGSAPLPAESAPAETPAQYKPKIKRRQRHQRGRAVKIGRLHFSFQKAAPYGRYDKDQHIRKPHLDRHAPPPEFRKYQTADIDLLDCSVKPAILGVHCSMSYDARILLSKPR